MSVNDISSLFSFIGGLGMFLYGMNIMADGMQKTAGSKMSQFLGMLTTQPSDGGSSGCADHGYHSEQRCHDGYGGGVCKCRGSESDTERSA